MFLSTESNCLICPMYRFMQPFSSELEQEESGFLLQHSPSNNLSTGFSGKKNSLKFGWLLCFTSTNNL